MASGSGAGTIASELVSACLADAWSMFKGDDAWVQEKCREKLLERLGPLDKIEQLEDYERCATRWRG